MSCGVEVGYIEKTADGMNISNVMQGTKSVRNFSNVINP